MPPSSARSSTRWTSRLLPVFLAGCASLVTYVVVARLCDQYLLKQRHQTGVVITILILHFLLLLITLSTYIRLLVVVKLDSGLVPLSEDGIKLRTQGPRSSKQSRKRSHSRPADVEAARYYNGRSGAAARPPGLESFYSRDVFVCESDGRPRWCHDCLGFKPDRAHHSSEMGRCVYKMDHFCPWVGGMVAENSFKFFFQFNVYATLFCALVLGSTAYGLKTQIHDPRTKIDPFFIASVALSGFFGLFTFMMSATVLRYIFRNLSTVDALNARTKVYQLAVRVDRDVQTDNKFGTVIYPLPDGQSARPAAAGEVEAASHQKNQSARDRLASRTFAILRTEPGENPWDLGWRGNWVSIMGTNVVDWLLPVRRSPCTNHDDPTSYYPLGPVVEDLRRRYGLKAATDRRDEIELRDMRTMNGHAR